MVLGKRGDGWVREAQAAYKGGPRLYVWSTRIGDKPG
jgi:hypothetical protein